MKTSERIVGILSEVRISPENTWIDSTSIGAGVYHRVRQLGLLVNAYKGGESPTKKTDRQKVVDPLEYYNLRAECFWKLRMWVIQGGALVPHKDWKQLSKIKYRVTSDKKIQIMSKEEMRARGDLLASESTDIPDAGSMTFVESGVKYNHSAKASEPVAPYYPDIDGGGFKQSPGGFNDYYPDIDGGGFKQSPGGFNDLDLN
jgi:hypothetical protein